MTHIVKHTHKALFKQDVDAGRVVCCEDPTNNANHRYLHGGDAFLTMKENEALHITNPKRTWWATVTRRGDELVVT